MDAEAAEDASAGAQRDWIQQERDTEALLRATGIADAEERALGNSGGGGRGPSGANGGAVGGGMGEGAEGSVEAGLALLTADGNLKDNKALQARISERRCGAQDS